jgi:LemA protein
MLDMYYTLIAIIICSTIVLWYLATFNMLVQSRNAVDQAWSNIEVELKRRFDLIQNLVETAKGYATHEQNTFQRVAELRNQSRPFGDAQAANSSQPELMRAVRQVVALAEDYPDLRANENFLGLQAELTATENRIAERRHAYNQNVNLYQNRCQLVPSNIVAGMHEFPAKAFFDAPDELADAAPKLQLT